MAGFKFCITSNVLLNAAFKNGFDRTGHPDAPIAQLNRKRAAGKFNLHGLRRVAAPGMDRRDRHRACAGSTRLGAAHAALKYARSQALRSNLLDKLKVHAAQKRRVRSVKSSADMLQ